MPYKPGFQQVDNRISAAVFSILPASGFAGVSGAALLLMAATFTEVFASEFTLNSLGDALMMVVVAGFAIAMGSIGGTVVVAFYLVLFGLPVTLLLGERIRQPEGLVVSVLTALVASGFAMWWLWGNHYSLDPVPVRWEGLIPVVAFAIPAAYFYRRAVIMAYDELDAVTA